MACFHPIQGYRRRNDRGIGWRPAEVWIDQPMSVPCGQCIGCRLEHSRQWAVRMMHEAQLWESNWFVTLTYDDDHIPEWGSLRKKDFQGFINKLRKARPRTKIRYFHCGEYGDETRRPHYHAALFNVDFPDMQLGVHRGEHRTYHSRELTELWGKGITELGGLTFESAGYIARYVTKKITGKKADSHYTRVDPETGELRRIEREYATMSRRPGIGAGWLERYQGEVYPADEVVMRGKVSKPPRYYDKKLEQNNPDLHTSVLEMRRKNRDRQNQTEDRLHVREVCTMARTKLFHRREGVA